MAYKLNKITIRTNNSKEEMKNIGDIWKDIANGKLPILFDSEHVFQHGVSPISKYNNYSSDENGEYDLTIMAVTADFFQKMDEEVSKGFYKKYDEKDEGGEISVYARKAWEKVWSEQKS